MKNPPIEEEYERCVMCGDLTSVLTSTPIHLREDYQVGCGQVCRSCSLKLRKEIEKENTLSDNQLVAFINKHTNK